MQERGNTRRFGRGTRLPNIDDKIISTATEISNLNFNGNDMKSIDKPTEPNSNSAIVKDSPIKLKCNYVPITFENNDVFMYSVIFEPEIESTAIRHRIFNQFGGILPEIKVFDGNVMYIIEELVTAPFTMTTSLPNLPNQDVKCTFTYIKTIKTHESHALINIIFRKVLRIMNLKLIGRNYYNLDLSVPIPKHKLHIWPGFITSIKNYDGGTFLNIDVTHRFLRMQTIYEQMVSLYSLAKDKDRFYDTCLRNIVGQTVITRYNNKSYRIDDIDFTKSPKDEFMWNGKLTSYVEYYSAMYGKIIQDTEQPLLIHRRKEKISSSKKSIFKMKKSSINDQNDDENLVCLIPELCYMTGLDDSTRLDYSIMKELSSYIHSNPSERFKSVHKFLESLHLSSEAMNELNKWGITIAMNSLNIDGRIFPNEKLICQQGKLQFSVDPASGWIGRLCKAHLYSAVELQDWICLHTVRDKSHVSKFVNCMIVCGNQFGMKISMPRFKELPNDKIETYISNIRNEINNRTTLVMIIVPTQREDRYAAIKRMLCCDLPIASQVIQTKTISNPRRLNSVSQRVAMQLNCKLGGELWAVHIPLKNVMAVGIDVYHPPSGSGRKLSTVAFVSSLSSSLTKWFTTTTLQNPGEIVTTVKACFTKALDKYVEQNGTPPSHIFIFRDGVGIGQLDSVRKIELNAFMECIDGYSFPIKPMLTFLVIVKRNNTRLYGFDPITGDNLSNPKPGTILDSVLVPSKSLCPSFYLVSQHFNQGTITPTCYQVIYNNSNLNLNKIQLFTYKCTYLYYNWPGTISVPAPCQYAHKAAYLTGQSLQKQAHTSLSDKLYYL